MNELVLRFRDALSADVDEHGVADLDTLVAQVINACGDSDSATVAAFGRYVLEVLPTTYGDCKGLHLEDLFLCFSSLTAGPSASAVKKLSQCVLQNTQAITRSQRNKDVDAADLAQTMLVLLLSGGQDGKPKLRQYAGRAPLSTWLRVIAIRHIARAKPSHVSALPLEELSLGDPELSYMKQAYRAGFKRAFHSAVAALSIHDRQLLRQSYVDGLNIEALGKLHNMHRATAARHLAMIRKKLFQHTRSHLQKELDLSSTEFSEVMGLIESRLEVSLSRVL